MPLGPWHWKVLSIVGDYDNKTATAPVQQQVEGDGIGKQGKWISFADFLIKLFLEEEILTDYIQTSVIKNRAFYFYLRYGQIMLRVLVIKRKAGALLRLFSSLPEAIFSRIFSLIVNIKMIDTDVMMNIRAHD